MNVPQGFELDAPAQASNVPTGFELDAPSQDEGALVAAGRGALRNFPLAQQAAAAIAPINPFSEKGNYSDEMQHLTQAAEASKEAHRGAYGAGAVAGTVAPLLIPGVGEALEAAPVIGNAGLAAAQSQSDTNLTNPTRENAKDALVAGLVGGGIGAVGKGVRAISPSEKTLAANSTGLGFGFNARGAQNLLKGADPEADVIELGKWANNIQTDEGKTLAQYLRPGEKLKALGEIHDSAGKAIGDVINQVTPEKLPDIAPFRDQLDAIFQSVEDINPQAQQKIQGVLNRLDKLENSGKLDFTSLQKLKSNVGANMGDEPALQQAYGILAEYVDKTIDSYSKVIKDPELYQSFNLARVNYRNASRLLPILRKAEGRELAQGPLGNSGLLGMFGLAGGMAAGHPAAGAAGMAASAVGRPIANMVGRNAALRAVPYIPAMAKMLPGMSSAAQMELANALQDRFGKKEKE